jgi:hypothetical protein
LHKFEPDLSEKWDIRDAKGWFADLSIPFTDGTFFSRHFRDQLPRPPPILRFTPYVACPSGDRDKADLNKVSGLSHYLASLVLEQSVLWANYYCGTLMVVTVDIHRSGLTGFRSSLMAVVEIAE